MNAVQPYPDAQRRSLGARFGAAITTATLAAAGLVALGASAGAAPLEPTVSDPLRFDLGPGDVADGYTQVTAETVYSDDLGYGFTPESEVTETDRGTDDAVRGDFVTVAEAEIEAVQRHDRENAVVVQ